MAVMSLSLFGKSATGIVLTTIIWSIGEYLFFQNINKILYKTIPEEHKGLASGLSIFCLGLANAICPLLGYFLLGNTALLIVLFFATSFLPIFLLFYKKRKFKNQFSPIIEKLMQRRPRY